MLENYDKQIIKPIKVGDFGSMEEFIEKRVKELNPTQMTYQLATNLRLYYEPKKRRKAYSIIYSFLSAIIHRTAYESICEEIKEKGSNESEILRVISNEFNLKKSLLPLDPLYLENINFDYFNDVEKIVFFRETCKGRGSKRIRDELNNIIYLNNQYLICLNPYKFNYYSKFVYDKIHEISSGS